MTARMTRGRVPGLRAAALALLTIVASGLACWLWVRTESVLDPSVAEVRSVTQGALEALYFDDLPPATYTGGLRPAPMMADMQARITADLARYFTDRLQARYTPMIENATDLIGTSDWDIDGGISSIDWRAAAILGDRATIGLRESQWVVRRHDATTYRLESTWDVEVTLVRETGQWHVDGFDTTCVSGCP
jgi:hypothetical protein